MLKDVLQKMRESSADVSSIARDPDIERGTLDAILKVRIRVGYIRKTSATLAAGVVSCAANVERAPIMRRQKCMF